MTENSERLARAERYYDTHREGDLWWEDDFLWCLKRIKELEKAVVEERAFVKKLQEADKDNPIVTERCDVSGWDEHEARHDLEKEGTL